MSRLTDADYLSAHYYLKDAWKTHDGVAFGLLLWREQRVLHDYFLPSKRISDKALLEHRRLVTKTYPSLPHRAGKALSRCRANVEEFNAHPPVPYVPGAKRQRPKREHRIVVRGVAVAEFDVHKLVRTLIRQQREADEEVQRHS